MCLVFSVCFSAIKVSLKEKVQCLKEALEGRCMNRKGCAFEGGCINIRRGHMLEGRCNNRAWGRMIEGHSMSWKVHQQKVCLHQSTTIASMLEGIVETWWGFFFSFGYQGVFTFWIKSLFSSCCQICLRTIYEVFFLHHYHGLFTYMFVVRSFFCIIINIGVICEAQ